MAIPPVLKTGVRKDLWVRLPPSPPDCTFKKIVRSCLGALRLGMVFFRYNPSIFKGERKRPLGNAEVRRAKLWQNEILQTNLFSFAFGEKLSVFFFDCPKAMDNINFPCGVGSNQKVGNFSVVIFPVSMR